MELAAWAAQLEASPLGAWMRGSDWAYPVVNLIHLAGLVLLVGNMLLLDLRLLGIGRRFALVDASSMLTRLAIAGLLLLIASGTGRRLLSIAQLVSRRGYSGYWEYHIEGALFTAPARPDHSGAGLFDADGRLLGIGSLIVTNALGQGQPDLEGNMFVPVDLLKPILGELRAHGASAASRRPWLGVNCVEYEGRIWVLRLVSAGPAETSGLRPGDQIAAIDGVGVSDLGSLYRTLWKGDPGKDVVLDIVRAGAPQRLTVHTRDRDETLRRPRGV